MDEQGLLDFAPPAIALEVAVGSNDPVTWDDDGQRIVTICGSNGACRGVGMKSTGNSRIGGNVPVIDLFELFPDQIFEGCSVRSQGKVENRELAREVGLDLTFRST